jgi:hypothetical protein
MSQLTKEDLIYTVKMDERGKFLRGGDTIVGNPWEGHEELSRSLRILTQSNRIDDAGFYKGWSQSQELDTYGSSATLGIGEEGSAERIITQDLIAGTLSGTGIKVPRD